MLVEHDIGRTVGNGTLEVIRRRCRHHRLIGPAEALREMNVEPLLGLLEGEQAALLIERPQECTQPSAASSFLVAADVTATTVGTP